MAIFGHEAAQTIERLRTERDAALDAVSVTGNLLRSEMALTDDLADVLRSVLDAVVAPADRSKLDAAETSLARYHQARNR